MYIADKELVKKKLDVYLNNYTIEQLRGFEEEIYTDQIGKEARACLELDRLKKVIDKRYYFEYHKMRRLLRVAYFDPTVLDYIYNTILTIQLDNNISIRLYSGIKLLKEMLDLDMFP